MTLEDETEADDPQAEAAFGAGFEDKETPPVEVTPEPAAETPREPTEPTPEHVQITKADYEFLRNAAQKVTSLEQQQSTAFGKIGGIQRVINELQSTKNVSIATPAYLKLKDQFPELAEMVKEVVESVPSRGDNAPDPDAIESKLAQRTRALQIEALEDAHPDWQAIVGSVGAGQQPDPNNPFRQWLATKGDDYQKRVNGTESADVLKRAISLFQKETTKPQPRQSPQANTRRDRFAAAVQPKGDGAASPPDNSLEDAFAAGFHS